MNDTAPIETSSAQALTSYVEHSIAEDQYRAEAYHQLRAALDEYQRVDHLKTKEINILVEENRKLAAAPERLRAENAVLRKALSECARQMRALDHQFSARPGFYSWWAAVKNAHKALAAPVEKS